MYLQWEMKMVTHFYNIPPHVPQTSWDKVKYCQISTQRLSVKGFEIAVYTNGSLMLMWLNWYLNSIDNSFLV
jgi:hypothetical protein